MREELHNLAERVNSDLNSSETMKVIALASIQTAHSIDMLRELIKSEALRYLGKVVLTRAQ